MTISLICTVYNEIENINRFLNSYKMQKRHADEFIIVDGGSSDGTYEALRAFSFANKGLNVKVIYDEECRLGRSASPVALGRNKAIAISEGEIIAVTDAGCILSDGWLAEIVRPFNSGCVDVVAGAYDAIEHDGFTRNFGKFCMPRFDKLDNFYSPSSRSLAFKRACWQEVGGYPIIYLTGEDTAFCLALRDRGFSFHLAQQALVHWECPKNYKELFIKQYRYAKGDVAHGQLTVKSMLHCMATILPLHLLVSSVRKGNGYFWMRYALLAANTCGILAYLLFRK